MLAQTRETVKILNSSVIEVLQGKHLLASTRDVPSTVVTGAAVMLLALN